MPLMQWTEKLSVGVNELDAEHQRLVAMLNDLYDAAQAGKGKDALGPILDGLITYTQNHFAHEERFMTQHKYPGFAQHKGEHEALAKQVLDVQAKYKAGAGAALSMEVLNFLKNWLTKHIQGTDKQYGPFFNERGIR